MVRTWIDNAAELDAPVIRIFAGTGPKGDREDAGGRASHRGDQCVAPYAAEKGVTLALENHGGITATPGQILKIVKAVEAPNFGVNLDTGNFRGEDPYADLAELAPYADQRAGEDRDLAARAEASKMPTSGGSSASFATPSTPATSCSNTRRRGPRTAVPRTISR